MPLYDSFSTAQSYRLPKMNSIPTTDDLRYAIAEAQKRVGKTIELPFEHPHNHQLFIVKLLLSVGGKTAPSWTLQRGDGASAVRLWNRNAEDCLMIQNKIRTDSQYVPSADGNDQQQIPSGQPMSLQSSFDNPFGGGAPAPAATVAPENTAPASPFSQPVQDYDAAFAAPPQIAPQNPSDNWMDSLVQAPSFNPNQSRTNMPAMHPGTAAPVAPTPKAAAPMISQAAVESYTNESGAPADDEFLDSSSEGALPSSSSGVNNLPPPIKLDVTLIDRISSNFAEPTTGLNNFASFVYFLFREQSVYQRSRSPYSVVVFEVALRIGHENMALPQAALPAVIDRVRNVISEFDIVCHLSGGEFAALIPGVDGAGVEQFATALHAALTTEPLSAGNRNEGVLAAIGMATTPDTCEDPEVLIAAARQAKESAKSLPNPILMFPLGHA